MWDKFSNYNLVYNQTLIRLQLKKLSHMFWLTFPSCKLYEEGALFNIFILKIKCHLEWTNQKGLTLKAKPKIK